MNTTNQTHTDEVENIGKVTTVATETETTASSALPSGNNETTTKTCEAAVVTENTPSKKRKKAKKKKEKRGKFYSLTRTVLGSIMRFFYRVHITGAENIPEGGAIICSNHIGYPDALLLGAMLPRQIHFLAKDELFHVPVLASAMRALGAVPVKRDTADRGAIKEIIRLSTEGRLVAVFPQGHRRYGQNPADTEIKHGIGIMAYRSNMPVVPVCIKMKKERYCIFRRVDLIIGTPVMYTDFCTGNTSAEYALATRAFFLRACLLGGYKPKLLTEGSQA